MVFQMAHYQFQRDFSGQNILSCSYYRLSPITHVFFQMKYFEVILLKHIFKVARFITPEALLCGY